MTICIDTNTATQQPTHNEKSQIERVCRLISKRDYSFLPADECKKLLFEISPSALSDWSEFQSSWDRLASDGYMADGGTYRKRRHATLSALPSSALYKIESHQPHYQSLSYNDLNGGIARHYQPVEDAVLHSSTMRSIVLLGCEIFGRLQPYTPWHIEVHQFRIEAQFGGQGKPTPEGIHRDGVGFVMMFLIKRENLVNGDTRIYGLDKLRIDEFTLHHPLDLAIVNDEHVFHGVTPIVQLDTAKAATRDVLVVTFRRKN